jgi:hypothetical protein
MVRRTGQPGTRAQQLLRSAVIGFLVGDVLLLGLYLAGRADTTPVAPGPVTTVAVTAPDATVHHHGPDSTGTAGTSGPVAPSGPEAEVLTCIQEYLARTPYDPAKPGAFDEAILAGQIFCASR